MVDCKFPLISKTRWIFALLALALALSAGKGVAGQSDAYKKHLAAAKTAQLRRDLVQAEAELGECLKIRKDDPEVHFLAARVARRSGNSQKAETHLKECERLKGDAGAIRLEKLLLRAQRGEIAVLGTKEVTAVAKELGKLISDKHPETTLILEAQAQGYEATYRPLEALACWEARENLDKLYQNHPKNTAVVLGLAKCEFYQGELKKAEKRLIALLADQPRNAKAWHLRGKAVNDPAQAEKWFRKALDLDPNAYEFNYSLFVCLSQQGKGEEAKQVKKRMEKLHEDFRRLKQMMQEIESKPHDASLRCQAGKIYLQSGLDQQGLAWLNSALQDDPNHRATHQALAEYYDRAGQKDRAEKHRKLAQKKK